LGFTAGAWRSPFSPALPPTAPSSPITYAPPIPNMSSAIQASGSFFQEANSGGRDFVTAQRDTRCSKLQAASVTSTDMASTGGSTARAIGKAMAAYGPGRSRESIAAFCSASRWLERLPWPLWLRSAARTGPGGLDWFQDVARIHPYRMCSGSPMNFKS
jgi:hypothetical protein